MKRFTTPARRALLVCTAWLGLPAHRHWPPGCQDQVKIGGPASLTLPDFTRTGQRLDPACGHRQRPAVVPNPNRAASTAGRSSAAGVAMINANTSKVDFQPRPKSADRRNRGAAPDRHRLRRQRSGDHRVNVTDAHNIVRRSGPHAAASASPASRTKVQLVTLDGSDVLGSRHQLADLQLGRRPGGPQSCWPTRTRRRLRSSRPTSATTTTLTFRLTVSDGNAVELGGRAGQCRVDQRSTGRRAQLPDRRQ